MDEDAPDMCLGKEEGGRGGSMDDEACSAICKVELGGGRGGLVDEESHCDMCGGEGVGVEEDQRMRYLLTHAKEKEEDEVVECPWMFHLQIEMNWKDRED